MKTLNIHRASVLVCLLFLVSFAHPIMAQSEDSVSIDSVSQAQEEPVPAKRPKPKAFIMGRISSKTILANMPQYKAMQRSMVALKAQYEAEAKKSEEDFQRKFEEFMQGQKEFPKTILEKRQNELQNMLETLLAEAEKSLMADIMAEMSEAISTVAQERSISIVFDTDNGSVPYMVSGLAVDLTSAVIQLFTTENESY